MLGLNSVGKKKQLERNKHLFIKVKGNVVLLSLAQNDFAAQGLWILKVLTLLCIWFNSRRESMFKCLELWEWGITSVSRSCVWQTNIVKTVKTFLIGASPVQVFNDLFRTGTCLYGLGTRVKTWHSTLTCKTRTRSHLRCTTHTFTVHFTHHFAADGAWRGFTAVTVLACTDPGRNTQRGVGSRSQRPHGPGEHTLQQSTPTATVVAGGPERASSSPLLLFITTGVFKLWSV